MRQDPRVGLRDQAGVWMVAKFSCHVIGADSLLVECLEVLLREGHEVRSVVTSTARIASYARERGLTVLDTAEDYPAFFASAPFDFLFSITHLGIHKPAVLALPRRGAVNFHDGPLPRYAGLNAPAFALMEGATEYAITWHWIVDAVDEGDILEQVSFDIAPGETSLTLNTRCFEAGIAAFKRLVPALADGTAVGRPQDLSVRSYFGRHQRPLHMGVLDWSRPAWELEAMVRALDFGRYPNPLGTAKVVHRGKALIVTAALVELNNSARPGEVLALTGESVLVACGEASLSLRGFAALDGTRITVQEAASAWSLRPGTRLDDLPPGTKTQIAGLAEALSRSEYRWLPRLRAFTATRLPHARSDVPAGAAPQWVRHGFDLPEEFRGEENQVRLLTALVTFAARTAAVEQVGLSFAGPDLWRDVRGLESWLLPAIPLMASLRAGDTLATASERLARDLMALRSEQPILRDLVARQPDLSERHELRNGGLAPIAFQVGAFDPAPGTVAALQWLESGRAEWVFDGCYLDPDMARVVVGQFRGLLQNLAGAVQQPLAEVELLSAAEAQLLLVEWNRTASTFRDDVCVHTLFEEQAARTPQAVALVAGDEQWTSQQLDERSNQIAALLRTRGVGVGSLVGLCLPRSADMVLAVLAIWKAGAAYLPLDPAFPQDRLAYMVQDSGCALVVTGTSTCSGFDSVPTLCLDQEREQLDLQSSATLSSGAGSRDLAYVIYTSGSTGKPKGVMVEHRNVVSFLHGMDDRIPHRSGDAWLAVTSLSFDISVLELAWTLTRGLKLVLFGGVRRSTGKTLAFSLSYFASNGNDAAAAQYELLLAGARFADDHGFHAVWTPERHFHSFGGLYPNPSVTSAAIAAVTSRVQIRAGSVVVALHHPVRIAEEWSLVDNLSHGRVGVSIASGWHPNDFVLAPDRYADRKEIMVRDIEVVRRLWRGEAVVFKDPTGKDVPTRIMPKPIQSDLPIWVTAAGNPETFEIAGRIGAGVLTHLLGQRPEELQRKIGIYRDAWRRAGHPGAGHVSLMLHTFIGPDRDFVKQTVRGPMREYLRSAVDLIKNHVNTWAPVRTSLTVGGSDTGIRSLDDLPKEDVEALLDYSFERYYDDNALFGTPESCMTFIGNLHAMGVDEICCLIDFGVPSELVQAHLPYLDQLRQQAARRLAGDEPEQTVASLISRHGITHLQCTPSMATMLAEDPETIPALSRLQVMMVGGEAITTELARKLAGLVGGRLLNMYGPTETTIWSTTAELHRDLTQVTIGKPIANTQLYVLDKEGRPSPIGVPGELYIGGEGVTRGYHGRAELTQERFVPDPFGIPGRRLYRTGDLVRWLPSGEVEFLGRADHQVKVRGYRIELGEIEGALASFPAVLQTVVTTRQISAQDTRLIAYATLREASDASGKALQEHCRRFLPDYMVPSEVVLLESMPMTPNGKIDRSQLATARRRQNVAGPTAPSSAAPEASPVASPPPMPSKAGGDKSPPPDAGALMVVLSEIWCEVLGATEVGHHDNFFDLGGHSLLTIKVQSRLKERLGLVVPLVDLFRHTTIATLAASLSRQAGPDPAVQAGAKPAPSAPTMDRGQQRAALRRQALTRRPPS